MPNGVPNSVAEDDVELPDESECSDGAIHHYWQADFELRKIFLAWIILHHDPGHNNGRFEP
jgi:hypothetical protein